MNFVKKLLLMKDHVCPWWLAYTFDNPLRCLFHEPKQILHPYLKKGMTVVDLGCGMGYFSFAMAEMVGDDGLVIAVDVQQKMLDILIKRALRKGVMDRITTHLCESNSVKLEHKVDFALSFWMVHETPDIRDFLNQIMTHMNPGGKYLVAEPRMHVSAEKFHEISEAAESAGFDILDRPFISLSRSILFQKPDQN